MSGHDWRTKTRNQLGLITRAQARGAGITDAAIHRHLACGNWEAVQPGVYRIGGTPGSVDQQLLGACLGAGSLSAASHRSAVVLHGYRFHRPAPAEISVDRERGLHLTGVTVHRSRDLRPDHVELIGDVPVTTPARTLVDLGQVVPWIVVRDVLENFVTRHLVSIDQMHTALLLHSRRGRRGCGALRRVLDQRALLDRPADSVLESAFADLCAACDVPKPEYQHVVYLAGQERHIDFAYPELGLAIEVDGFETHATVAGFTSDRIRGNELALLGWTVLHFTWQQVVHQPAYVASVIARARAQALRNGPPAHKLGVELFDR